MNKVKVLVEGYAKVNPDGTWDATSTTTLIDIGKHKIIMDPGCNRELLLGALAKEGLQAADIDTVFISHYHPDHYPRPFSRARLTPGSYLQRSNISSG